jgi:hypothetical protein
VQLQTGIAATLPNTVAQPQGMLINHPQGIAANLPNNRCMLQS